MTGRRYQPLGLDVRPKISRGGTVGEPTRAAPAIAPRPPAATNAARPSNVTPSLLACAGSPPNSTSTANTAITNAAAIRQPPRTNPQSRRAPRTSERVSHLVRRCERRRPSAWSSPRLADEAVRSSRGLRGRRVPERHRYSGDRGSSANPPLSECAGGSGIETPRSLSQATIACFRSRPSGSVIEPDMTAQSRRANARSRSSANPGYVSVAPIRQAYSVRSQAPIRKARNLDEKMARYGCSAPLDGPPPKCPEVNCISPGGCQSHRRRSRVRHPLAWLRLGRRKGTSGAERGSAAPGAAEPDRGSWTGRRRVRCRARTDPTAAGSLGGGISPPPCLRGKAVFVRGWCRLGCRLGRR